MNNLISLNILFQLIGQDVSIEYKQKKSILIRSLPESLSMISNAYRAQADMIFEDQHDLTRV